MKQHGIVPNLITYTALISSCLNGFQAYQALEVFGSMQHEALRLQLTGWVRNLADGRVEFVATGHEARVASLIEWARSGPAFARVDELYSEVRDIQHFQQFEVRA